MIRLLIRTLGMPQATPALIAISRTSNQISQLHLPAERHVMDLYFCRHTQADGACRSPIDVNHRGCYWSAALRVRQGWVDRGSGEVELQFEARFNFTVNLLGRTLYAAPPLRVTTTLTTAAAQVLHRLSCCETVCGMRNFLSAHTQCSASSQQHSFAGDHRRTCCQGTCPLH